MNQELYAFWKYDLFPYTLGGKVVKFAAGGLVQVEGYGNMLFRPIGIVQYDEGVEIMSKIKKIKEEHKAEIDRVNNHFNIELFNVATFMHPARNQ